MKRQIEHDRIIEHINELLSELHQSYKAMAEIEAQEENLTNKENFTYNKLLAFGKHQSQIREVTAFKVPEQPVLNDDGTEIIFEKFIDTDGTEITLPIFIGYDSHNKPLYF